MARLVECVPNFSEGRDKALVEKKYRFSLVERYRALFL